MEKLVNKKIKAEHTANRCGDIVFSAEKVYCVNLKDEVVATFNSHKDYLMDEAVEYTKNKDEFLIAMGKVFDAVVNQEKFTKSFSKKNKSDSLKRKINTLFGLGWNQGGVK